MSKKICVAAYNIHQGGGKVVLLAFLKEKIAEELLITCYVDERLDVKFHEMPNVQFIKVKANFSSRIRTEHLFKKNSANFDIFYFVGNLPPLFKLSTRTILFLQNRLLISPPYINTLSMRTIARSILELIWFKQCLPHVDLIQVQTPSMQKTLKAKYPKKSIEIHNYMDSEEIISLKKEFESLGIPRTKSRFVYIASADPHKNIKRLIIAFSKISPIKNPYTLYINLDKNSKYVSLAKSLNVNLVIIDSTSRHDLLKIIYSSEYLIFPSTLESLGLPLIEASLLGTKVIASNLDFVYDSCTPMFTFNPRSVESIAHVINSALNNGKNELG